jgi:1-acyl-sn-glycerol-3-phosphate acyltransferase
VAAWTAWWSLVWGTATLLLLPLQQWKRRWRIWCLRQWARGITTILHVDIVSDGPVPRGAPFVLVTNHLSYLDVIILAQLVGAVFVAKREVRSWPVWGVLSRAMETIYIDRERRRDTLRASDAIERSLHRGDNVVIFPEGTSTEGSIVAPFRSSLLAAAARTGRAVHYASLSYRTGADDPPARLAVCWWGDMEFAPHFWALCGITKIEASVRFGDEPVRADDRKQLALSLRRAVTNGFTPVTNKEQA